MRTLVGVWQVGADGRGTWAGLGVRNKFYPFTASSIEEAKRLWPTIDAASFKPMDEASLLEGLPYPDKAGIGATVEWDGDNPTVVMDSALPWETASVAQRK